MSSTANPISPARFASALGSLPLSSLHEKAAEIRTSVAHLHYSNVQLKPLADQGDVDCADAIAENEVVVERMNMRLEMLKREVEGRGMMWVDEDWTGPSGMKLNGDPAVNHRGTTNGRAATNGNDQHPAGLANEQDRGQDEESRSALLTDQELSRRIDQQIDEDEDDEGGLHL